MATAFAAIATDFVQSRGSTIASRRELEKTDMTVVAAGRRGPGIDATAVGRTIRIINIMEQRIVFLLLVSVLGTHFQHVAGYAKHFLPS